LSAYLRPSVSIVVPKKKKHMMAAVFFFLLIAFFPSTSAECLGKSVCQDMWNKAKNYLLNVKLFVEPATAETNLFQLAEGPDLLEQRLPFETFKALMDNWSPNPETQGYTKTKRDFVGKVAREATPMNEAFNYLKSKGLLPNAVTDLVEFRKTLKDMWFKNVDNMGFEYTFVGLKTVQHRYQGFNNWYQFYLQQKDGKISSVVWPQNNFKPGTEPPFVSDFKFSWDGKTKGLMIGNNFYQQGSNMFVGTSPAFDIALFTVCFIELKGKECQCNIGRTTITVKTDSVKGAPNQIDKAYPFDVKIQDGRCIYEAAYRTKCGEAQEMNNQGACEAKGCCFQANIQPACFYPRDHKCDVSQGYRKSCGVNGITRLDCENMSCCFADNVCFKGNL